MSLKTPYIAQKRSKMVVGGSKNSNHSFRRRYARSTRFTILYRTYYRLNSKRFTYNIPYYTLYTKHGALDTLLRRPPIWAYDGRFGRVGPPAYGARTVGAGRRGGWPRAGRNTAARPQTCTSRSVSRSTGWRAPRAADASTQNRGADSVFPNFFNDIINGTVTRLISQNAPKMTI